MVEYYKGRVCKKHPDLKGQRYISNACCVGCNREHNEARRIRKDFLESLVSRVETLEKEVAELKRSSPHG